MRGIKTKKFGILLEPQIKRVIILLKESRKLDEIYEKEFRGRYQEFYSLFEEPFYKKVNREENIVRNLFYGVRGGLDYIDYEDMSIEELALLKWLARQAGLEFSPPIRFPYSQKQLEDALQWYEKYFK
jgi:hypothetical protein